MGAKELKQRRDVLSSLLNLPVWSSFPSEWERHGMNSWCSVHFPTGLNRISSSYSTSQRGRRAWKAAQASQGRRWDCRDTTQAVSHGSVAVHRELLGAWSKTALLFFKGSRCMKVSGRYLSGGFFMLLVQTSHELNLEACSILSGSLQIQEKLIKWKRRSLCLPSPTLLLQHLTLQICKLIT